MIAYVKVTRKFDEEYSFILYLPYLVDFFHLTLDEGIVFFVILRYPLGVGVNLLVEQG